MSSHYLVLSSPINDDCANVIASYCTGLVAKRATALTIAFNSAGGNIAAGFQIHSILRAMPYEVTMHATSIVGSIGIVIYAAAKNRLANRNANFIFHDAGDEVLKRVTEFNASTVIERVKSLNRKMASAIEEVSNITEDKFLELAKAETSVPADAAREMGLVQDICELAIPEGANVMHHVST